MAGAGAKLTDGSDLRAVDAVRLTMKTIPTIATSATHAPTSTNTV